MGTVFFASASELATLGNTFSVGGVATDPTTVSLAVTDPTGTATTYTYAAAQITRSSAGVYTKDVSCPTAGEWAYVWTGTGTASDVTAGSWTVQSTDLGHLYITPQALRSRIGIAATDTSQDLEIHAACFSASRQLEDICDRTFYRTLSTEARTFEASDPYLLQLPDYCDLVSVTELATDPEADGTFGTVWTAADYQLLPVNPSAAPEAKPYTAIKAIGGNTFPVSYAARTSRTNLVRGTCVWGWPAVPQVIHTAAGILAAETLKLKDAPFGVAAFGEYGAIRVRTNPMVEKMIQRYMRNPWLVA